MPAMPTQNTRYAHSYTRTIPPWKIRMSNNAQINLLIYDVLFPSPLTRRLQAYSVHILPLYYEGPPQEISSAAGHSLINNLARFGKSSSERVLLSGSSISVLARVIRSSFWSLSLPPKPITCFSCHRFLWCQLCCLACDYVCRVCRLRFIFTFITNICTLL